MNLKLVLTFVTLISLTADVSAQEEQLPRSAFKSNRPSVMFIAVDDLNHCVSYLQRNKQARTPNIDRLANMGVTFTRAYCATPARELTVEERGPRRGFKVSGL